jgi:hypothetical protein
MSLNAVVYCDCVEKGQVTIRHPRPDLLFIDETGSPDISSADPQDIEAHDRWESLRPCRHEHFWLIERWLGNVSLIGSVREVVSQCSNDPAREYSLLWSKVVYNGSHSGDFLTLDDVLRLKDEVDRLSGMQGLPSSETTPLAEFLSKLRELVQASLSVKKPISF